MSRLALAIVFSAWIASTTLAEVRVLPVGRVPADTRLGPLKGEQGDFRFVPAQSVEEWQLRAEWVRKVTRVSMGLWPMPTRTPLNAVIHGKIDFPEYTIEKVYFESVPGFYVTGNLYRPRGVSGKRPAVLSPHGHFPGGRFQDQGRDDVLRKINHGAERFEDGGRSFMQSRCVQLARMGCVVFHYDMIGYADCTQIPLDVAHRFSGLRGQFKQPSPSGLYSASALLKQHNSLGLHTFNSIRAIDFLTNLPDVDAKRIAVTGGSGGGTQTFMLCAVDDRPLVSVPVVIVSTTRQGGCTCENICGFRVGTNNLLLTALHAPKPLLLVSADDATRTMPQRGFPILERHYRMLGSEKNLAHKPLLQFPHNYNHVSRAAMYHWLNRHLELGLEEPILERPYRRLTGRELTVWGPEHPAPTADARYQERLWAWFDEDARRQLDQVRPHDGSSLRRYREVVGAAWDILIRRLPDDARVEFDSTRVTEGDGFSASLGLLRYRTIEDDAAELPIMKLVPRQDARRAVVWLHARGKRGLFSEDGGLREPVRRLLAGGTVVVGVDLLDQGEFLSETPGTSGRSRWLEGEEGFGGWTYCYNLPIFAKRVHDVLAVATWLRQDFAVSLLSLDRSGPWGAAALALSPELFESAAINTHQFRFANLQDIYDANFLPGAVKFGDVPALLALCAPRPLWLAGESAAGIAAVEAAYDAAGRSKELSVVEGRPEAAQVVEWLMR